MDAARSTGVGSRVDPLARACQKIVTPRRLLTRSPSRVGFAEAYPQLKSTPTSATLQRSSKGTENRIAVARERYI